MFRLVADRSESVESKPATHHTSPVRIDLADSVVRGDATLLDADEPLPVQLNWQNGLFASEQPLLVADLRAGEAGDAVSVELRHITALARGGLCRVVQSPERAPQRTVELRVSDSVVAGAPTHPLVEHIGAENVAAARRNSSMSAIATSLTALTWRGVFAPRGPIRRRR